MIAVLHRRRALASGDQQGYALLLVLAILALTSLMIVALLGLALNTANITSMQSQAERELRAADGALEGAIATMARATGEGCTAVPTGAAVPSDNGSPADTSDDTAVTVQCAGATSGFDPADPIGGPDVKIVGDSKYTPGVTVPSGGTSDPTLAATGTAPLAFDSDVTVRRGASVSRTDTGGNPAVRIAGQYVQGAAGPGGSGNTCGQLATGGGQPGRVITDRNDAPVCANGAAAALEVANQQLVGPGDTTAAPPRNVPACGAAGGVVILEPGRYDAVETSKLNQLLGGSCGGRTFWFKPSSDAARPGVFVFDANASRAGGAALVINDPSISVVFGAPSASWDPAAGAAPPSAFPQACDPTRSGASVQLSGRMGLRHLAGRVALCPAFNNGAPLPSIVQVPFAATDPVTIAASSTDFRLAGGADGGLALLANANDAGVSATASFSCSAAFFWETCVPSRALTAKFANVPSANITSARVQVASRETPPAQANDNFRRVSLQVTSAAGAVLCTTAPMDGGRTHWQLSSYDLVSDPACSTALLNKPGSLLEDATVRLTYSMAPPCFFGQCPPGGQPIPTLSVRGVRLVVNASAAESSAANGTTGWVSVDSVRRNDAAASRFPQSDCGPLATGYPCASEVPGSSRDLTVENLRFPNGTDGRLLTLRVLVRNRPAATPGGTWVSDPIDDSTTQFTLNLSDGRSCTVTVPGYSNSNQESQFDLLATGGCAGTVTSISDLQGANLRVRITTGCSWFNDFRLTPGGDGRCGTVAMPEFQYVALAATTSSTARPPRSEVTVDATTSGNGSSFNVFGDTILPSSDLDLHWKGPVTTIPLFYGSLVVFGLGSEMSAGAQMGVVCCAPPSGAVRLRASVGPTVRAEAVVQLGPPPSPGAPRSVAILDWQLCSSGGCPGTAPVVPVPP